MSDLTSTQNDVIDFAIEDFHAAMVIAGQIAWNNIDNDLNAMAIRPDGKLNPDDYFNQTVKDVNLGFALESGYQSTNYENGLQQLKDSIDVLYDLTRQYYLDMGVSLISKESGYNYEVMAKSLATTMKNEIDEKLGLDGFIKDVSEPAQEAMSNHLNNGSTKAAMYSDMQHRIEDRFYNFAVTKALTMMAQYIRRLNEIYARYSDSPLHWVRYEGPLDDVTRDFCADRMGTADGFYMVDEVRDWVDKYSPWGGMIPGTDKGSIFVNLGGYNCRHALVYVLPSDVPPAGIAHAKYGGYLT